MRDISKSADLFSDEVVNDIFSDGTDKSEFKFHMYADAAKKYGCVVDFKKMYREKKKVLAAQEVGLYSVNTYTYKQKEYIMPQNFMVKNNRILEYSTRTQGFEKIYDGALIIDTIYKNTDTGDIFFGLINIMGNKNKRLTIHANVINDIKRIAELSSQGVLISVRHLNSVSHYLTEFITMNRKVITKNLCTDRFGWLNHKFKEFLPYGDIHFAGSEDFISQFKAVESKGDYEIWKKEINEICLSNDSLRLYIAASFASPLLEVLQKQGFIVHMHGKTEIGKTVAMYAAMSVWGDPVDLCTTFNTTAVGMERHANLFRNMPLAVDEGELGNSNVLSFEKFAYLLSQGKGKHRGTRDGGLQKPTEWNLISITNAEKSILEDNSKEGMNNRIVEISCDTPTSKDLIKTADIVRNNYGFAGRKLINQITKGKLSPEIIKEIYNKFYTFCYKDGKKASKQAIAYAILLLGDVLREIVINGTDHKMAMASTLMLYEVIEKNIKSLEELDRTKAIYNEIAGWVSENSNNFIKEYSVATDYGDDGQRTSIPRGKIFGKYNGKSSVYIYCKSLQEYLYARGYSKNDTLKRLKEAGYLMPSKDGYAINVSINHATTRCYHLILPGATEAYLQTLV
jgi:uncharacterized protein (DUF927 family)